MFATEQKTAPVNTGKPTAYKILLFRGNRYVETQVVDAMRLGTGARVFLQDNTVKLNDETWKLYNYMKLPSGDKAMLLPTEGKIFSILNRPVIRIGKDRADDIFLKYSKASLVLCDAVLTIYEGTVYLDGVLREPGRYLLQPGDTIFLDSTEICFGGDFVTCIGGVYQCLLNEYFSKRQLAEDFPNYARSPRIIKREPTATVELKDPPKKEAPKKGALVRLILPPLVMMSLTIGVSLMMGRGIYMIVMAAGTLVSTVVSVTNYFQDKKDRKQKETESATSYQEYLLRQRKMLHRFRSQFIDAKTYHNPSVQEIAELVDRYSNRIYERRSSDADFLQISLGSADCEPSYKVQCKLDDFEANKDPLYLEMLDVYKSFTMIRDIPKVIDLKNAHLGIVGESSFIHTQLKALLAQLAFMHSYRDIEIVLLTDPQSREEFEWVRWYPHCRIASINVSGLISSENQRDQVLGNISQMLKQRKQYLDESKRDARFTPHYVFVIDNPNLVLSHSIMEFLQEEDTELGFSIIYTTHLLSNLPENIKTILMLDTKDKGTLLLDEGLLVDQPIQLHNIENVDLEAMSRALAPLIHNQGVTTQIPESISFFELYNVKHPTELPIERLWASNASHKSLAVPLGVRGKDDIVYLNLHEKSHGPHGLVAGTTGSGKSEILQSFILSLAVNFHPHEVGFLLIDYKGGGMANLFKDLPHLLGTITNLDGSESMRALASIKSELARRQRIFNEHDVNAINQYTKLFKEGKAKEPLPHLFLISDEFAELKKEQPEFMRELVSAARIGRSLGVHLILATQKPSGVVDDQIWSNSKFKLALKVQNESDSREVIKTPDAARIIQPGRAYLQVGNNEIYELFQSAWSGAAYSKEHEDRAFDSRVYLVNDLGQGVLLNDDLSDMASAEDTGVTQLDATVAEIQKVYLRKRAVAVAKPWLPPLEEQIVSPHIDAVRAGDVGQLRKQDMTVQLGRVDLPESQSQIEYVHDFFKDGNLAIFGASGFGKSTTAMTIALSLAMKNAPDLLQFYIMDFGNASLIPLKGLPQTADYLSFDDTDKHDKLYKLLLSEVATRKKLFARENAINFNMYNTVAKQKLPVILLVIDNYDVIKELGYETEEVLTKITRDGVGLGIYTVIAATRQSAVRYAVLNNFKDKIVHFMHESSDIYALVGRSDYTLPEIRGRAMVRMEDVSLMQVYLPLAFTDEMQYTAGLRNTIDAIARNCSVSGANGIPVLPDILTIPDLLRAAGPDKRKRIVLGLDTESVRPQFFDSSAQVQLIVGTAQTGKSNLLKLILGQLAGETVFIADSKTCDLQNAAERPNTVYMSNAAQASVFVARLKQVIEERKALLEQQGGRRRPKDFYAALPRVSILIDDADYFVECCAGCAKEMEALLPEALVVGVYIYSTTAPSKMRGYDPVTKLLKDTTHGVLLGNPSDQSIFIVPSIRGYKPQVDMGMIARMGQQVMIKIPQVE